MRARKILSCRPRPRYLSTDLKEIVNPIYKEIPFSPTHKLFFTIITNEGGHARELGLQRILKARHTLTAKSARQFRLPTRCCVLG